VEAPAGPAVSLTSLLGLPFARIRMSLPDELLSWDMGTALGRKHTMSLSGMEAAYAAEREAAARQKGSGSALDAVCADVDATPAADASEQNRVMEEFVGTALVLSFLQVAALMPVARLAERRSAAKAHFRGVTVRLASAWRPMPATDAQACLCRRPLAGTLRRL
jgi:hypothetical protein